jgi:hypothetical protein
MLVLALMPAVVVLAAHLLRRRLTRPPLGFSAASA